MLCINSQPGPGGFFDLVSLSFDGTRPGSGERAKRANGRGALQRASHPGAGEVVAG